jgi:hypothetical protein
MATSHAARKRKKKCVMRHDELKKQKPTDAGQTSFALLFSLLFCPFVLPFCLVCCFV